MRRYSALPGSMLKSPIQIAASGFSGSGFAIAPVARRLVVDAAPWAAIGRRPAMLGEQIVDLLQPLLGRDMGEMQRQHPHRTGRRADHAFECRIAGVERPQRAAHRQRMQARPDDRQLRQHHGAELPAPVDDAAVALLAGVHVEGRTIDPVIAGQQPGKKLRLVVLIAALPVPFHFLQRDDVGAGNDLGTAREGRSGRRCRTRTGCCS